MPSQIMGTAAGSLPAEMDVHGPGDCGFQPGMLGGADGAALGGIHAVSGSVGLMEPIGVAACGPGQIAAVHGIAQGADDGKGDGALVNESGGLVGDDHGVGILADGEGRGVGIQGHGDLDRFPALELPVGGRKRQPALRAGGREGHDGGLLVGYDKNLFGGTERSAGIADGGEAVCRADSQGIANGQHHLAGFHLLESFIPEQDRAGMDAGREGRGRGIQEDIDLDGCVRRQVEFVDIHSEPVHIGFHEPERVNAVGFGDGVGLVFGLERSAYLAGRRKGGRGQHGTEVRHVQVHEDGQMVRGSGAGPGRQWGAGFGQAAAEVRLGIVDLGLR